MRLYLYLLAGLTSALIGWNLGQLFLTDLAWLPWLGWLAQYPELILFPCMAASLAIGMVANEIFVSNPTRPKRSFLIAPKPLGTALLLGLVIGSLAGGLSQILFLPQIPVPTPAVRVLGWLAIGGAVGRAEGVTWRERSMEAGDPERFRQRKNLSLSAAIVASAIAAGLFESVRFVEGQMPAVLKAAEDPLGFAILGLSLGLAFCITNSSPSYIPALRAGTGFEFTGETYDDIDGYRTTRTPNYPRIQNPKKPQNPQKSEKPPKPVLKFASYKSIQDREEDEIEEGLSIQLLGTVQIGSAPIANICIPELPLNVATIKVEGQKTILKPNRRAFGILEVNGNPKKNTEEIELKHNDVLTFRLRSTQDGANGPKIYRFVYYNRFLDPLA